MGRQQRTRPDLCRIASAWLGTRDGHLDGLPAFAEIAVDLADDDKLLALHGPVLGRSRTALDLGFSTRTAAQAEAATAGLLTREEAVTISGLSLAYHALV